MPPSEIPDLNQCIDVVTIFQLDAALGGDWWIDFSTPMEGCRLLDYERLGPNQPELEFDVLSYGVEP